MDKKKVLVVDDEKEISDMLKSGLERTGKYEVITENNPLNALNSVKKNRPNLILLDILMPKMDGLKVLEKLKSDNATMPIPVIMLSGVTTEEAKQQAANLYNESYLEKRVSLQEIEAEIDKVLERFKA